MSFDVVCRRTFVSASENSTEGGVEVDMVEYSGGV